MGEIEKVPLAAYEAQAERDHKTLRYLIVGWVITCALFAFVVCMMISYDEETVTYDDVAQEANDNGSNVYAGGDYYGAANDKASSDSEKARD